ncbi:hypothetical protein SAMN05444920_10979 [Nonomuraea solani]|uniref:Uncharacterized protein n=1 Tax=Nonomuraea solani TaxID=1144553 RepID=A0A1H6ECC7_9ACTN|nr:DUF5988 family protein [Nonomuraea solani]SEG95488.1 hypothetical protein SAMN05444920_10979 [Nonomuraea solani]
MRPVLLAGGPQDLPDDVRHRQVPAAENKISVEFRGGREHFCYTGESRTDSGDVIAVYEWSYRTEIAE